MRTRADRIAFAAMVATFAAYCIGVGAALALAGCAQPQIIARPVELPLPARPVLPPVRGASLQCLASDAYAKLVARERALKSWGEQMEAIIRANNDAAAKADNKAPPP